MTVHLDLEELMVMIAEADYNGKINDHITFVSTQVIIPAGTTFDLDQLWKS